MSKIQFESKSQLWNGMLQGKNIKEGRTNQGNKKLCEERIHPNHKPIALYCWILLKYAKIGWKILDTHGGAMSIAIACDKMKFDLDICEIDDYYFNKGKERYELYKRQLQLF